MIMKLSQRWKTAIVAGTAVLLAACSALPKLESDSIEYKSAAKNRLPDLRVPPDLTKPTTDDRYALPDQKSGTLASEYDKERKAAPDPARTAVLPAQTGARV